MQQTQNGLLAFDSTRQITLPPPLKISLRYCTCESCDNLRLSLGGSEDWEAAESDSWEVDCWAGVEEVSDLSTNDDAWLGLLDSLYDFIKGHLGEQAVTPVFQLLHYTSQVRRLRGKNDKHNVQDFITRIMKTCLWTVLSLLGKIADFQVFGLPDADFINEEVDLSVVLERCCKLNRIKGY
ncbi:hypothetical protein MAR_014385 [Mya arenaria]|uniref:Uncharacterized protein n=1 Tax=Mya arenaria TaxID=6604 RepID=A0ABY7G6M1_MYAAR|nr:hypothetical protein MAR_014385 [Mya arenaria]